MASIQRFFKKQKKTGEKQLELSLQASGSSHLMMMLIHRSLDN